MKTLTISLAALLLSVATAVAADEPETELRVFDISHIVSIQRAALAPELGPQALLGNVYPPREEEDPVRFMEGDAISDLIRETISPDVWDEYGEVQYRQGGALLVRAPADVQARVAKLLSDLEKAASRRVRYDAELYALPPGRYPEVVAGADPRRIEDPSVHLIASGSVEAPPGLTKSIAVTNRVRYVADFDAEIAQGANIGNPIVVADFEGLVVDVYGYPTLDGSKVLLRARLQSGRFRTDPRTVELALDEEYLPRPLRTGHRNPYGRIELPEYDGADGFVTRAVSDGGSFTLPILVGDRFYALRLAVDLLGGPEYVEALAVGATVGRFPGGAYGMPDTESWLQTLMVPAFIPAEETQRPPGGPEELLDLITANVHPEQWETGHNLINVFGDHRLFVHGAAPLLRQVHDFLAAREKEALRTVELGIEVRSVAGPVTAGEEREPTTGSTLRYAARLSALPGRLTGVMTGSRAAYVADYDVEVAQESRIADPIVGLAFDGLVANLRPTLSLDRSRVQVEVQMLIADRGPFREFDTGAGYLGPIDRFETNRILVRQTIEMAANGGYVIDAGPDPQDTSRRLAVVITNRLP